MQQRGDEKCFAPVWNQNSRVLVLGSYPSPKSFEHGFYYGHPQNRFWPLLATLFGAELPVTIPQKKRLLLDNSIALWDTLESCKIMGASDSSITDPVPNDLVGLLGRTSIEAVFCNGAASFRFYEKYALPKTCLPATKLPSTSPANAAFGLPRLVETWGTALAPYLPAGNRAL